MEPPALGDLLADLDLVVVASSVLLLLHSHITACLAGMFSIRQNIQNQTM